ncbi:helix-turn-helix domain-containing protein [Butyricicoccus sp.]|uniref:helix-turn-helix domain-containing protein n=1 Tax=Butyricicoccus sp. TaxID=2049021 RepID=UPI003D7DA050
MDTNDRVKMIRKSLKLNQTDFARKIGIKQSALSSIESKQSSVTDRNIKAICDEYRINEHWLRTGEGEMLCNTSDESIVCCSEELELIKKYRILDEHGKKVVNFVLAEEYHRIQEL